jgi:hypothetical protein
MSRNGFVMKGKRYACGTDPTNTVIQITSCIITFSSNQSNHEQRRSKTVFEYQSLVSTVIEYALYDTQKIFVYIMFSSQTMSAGSNNV